MAINERDIVKHQTDSLNLSRLEKVESVIDGYFSNLEKQYLSDSLNISKDLKSFQEYLQKEPLIKNGIIFDVSGKRLFPKSGDTLSKKERVFIEKASMFREERLASAKNGKVHAPRQISKISSFEQRVYKSDENNVVDKFGWYTWYAGAEQNHIFWWHYEGKIFGVEIFHARLVSDIITLLPDASGRGGLLQKELKRRREPKPNSSLIKLKDNNDDLIYQWGVYLPVDDEKYSSVLTLRKPLGGWKLEYYSEDVDFNPLFNTFNIITTLIVVGGILGGLAYYLYREHRREIILGRQRVNFVSQVSHELKTPLTNIRMYAELLGEKIGDNLMDNDIDTVMQEQKYVEIISSESQRLSRLIANILNFSKSAKSGLKIHKREGEIDTVIQTVLSKFQASFEAKEFAFDLQLDAKKEVMFDHDALEQILNNLFSNVEKYAADGKYLQVKSDQGHGITTITILDNGVGIILSEQQNIFKPFYRISSKLTDGVSGTGIGLGIARELAILHGGDLQLVPTESGSLFRLDIETPDKA
ncbi:MAG: sensor histidine kinase [Desulfobulbaceae bacterium]|nr:MAG: sensor histidine kinase [Desulfobulbaceae bacterium]